MIDSNILITVCGGTGSGKTTVAKEIAKILPKNLSSQIICLDQFYKNLNEIDKDLKHKINFDHPNSFDWVLIKDKIKSLMRNEAVEIPVYDYTISQRKDEFLKVEPTKIIILEGILTLYDKEINDLSSLNIYVDTPDDERFIRRMKRDKSERNRSDDSIIAQWKNSVRPMHQLFINPQKADADIIIPWYRMNEVAIRAIKGAIQTIISDKNS